MRKRAAAPNGHVTVTDLNEVDEENRSDDDVKSGFDMNWPDVTETSYNTLLLNFAHY
jgi:hypothetical protein